MLRHCLAPSLRRHLNELPQSLDETYERVLREIHLTNQGNARRLLHCLAVARRPLRVKELAEVLAYDLDATDGEIPTFHAEWRWEDQEQAVLSACSSLISIVNSGYGYHRSRVVQFSHFSVKEFLTSKRLAAAGGDISQYHILPEPAHTILTQACLGVLLRLDDHVDEWDAEKIPLAEYAAKHWVSHAQVENVASRVTQAMGTLFNSEKPHFGAWLRIYREDSRPRLQPIHKPTQKSLESSQKPSMYESIIATLLSDSIRSISPQIPPVYAKPLYYSALYGFHTLVEQLSIKDPQHVNTCSGDHDYPLLAALWGKHIKVAEFLIEHGANIDAQGSENQTPLHKVIQWSNDAVFDAMQFLLKHGADVNARRDDLSTPLHLAASMGSFKAAQMLLSHSADVDSRNVTGKTPLHLVPDIYIPVFDDTRRYPLLQRSWGGLGVAQLLLERGADPNAQDDDHITPLHLASEHGSLEITRVLLDHGAKVNVANKRGETPLHQVLHGSKSKNLYYSNHLGVARLLLERGGDANAQDNDHITPLHLASDSGSLEIARALLDHGAKVNAENNRGETSLHQLSKGFKSLTYDCLDVARLLLERGADVNARDDDQLTPLHLASSDGTSHLARVLLDYGANVNAKNTRGQTPLFQLIERERSPISTLHTYLDIAGLLVELGADANTRGEDNTTALHLVSKHGLPDVVRVLMDHGAIVDAEDSQGLTPLHLSSKGSGINPQSYLDVVRSLLGHGANVNARDKDNATPLHFATSGYGLVNAPVLLDGGAYASAKDNRGQTPLHRLLTNYNYPFFGTGELIFIRVLLKLLKHGVDVNAEDEDRATALHLAFGRHDHKAAPVLLDHGANPNAKNNQGETPLHRLLKYKYFREKSHLYSVQLLLEHGANADVQDNDGATPLQLTSRNGWLEVARLLRSHGATDTTENDQDRTQLHTVHVSSKMIPVLRS